MRLNLRSAAAVAVVLGAASSAAAQLVIVPTQASFGRRTSIFVQPRVGPFGSFSYWDSSYGPSPFFGAPWAFGGPFVPPQPIVIQNIIQQPPVMAAARGGGVIFPPEFDPPAVKPPMKVPKLGPAPRPPEVVVPDPARPPAAPGRAEADRITESGRKAFANGQYGRALELFRKAVAITPDEPSAHFLVSQALFALGKYREAVAAIGVGIALRVDWADARFVARELYWKKPVVFDDHVRALREAVTAFPDDAGLLFLLGHQLWFDGKHDEARALIVKARELGKGQTPAESFLVK